MHFFLSKPFFVSFASCTASTSVAWKKASGNPPMLALLHNFQATRIKTFYNSGLLLPSLQFTTHKYSNGARENPLENSF